MEHNAKQTNISSIPPLNELDGEHALIQTADFFAPVTDDMHLAGQIAAAHAMGPVYAAGSEPRFAQDVLSAPETADTKALLKGARKKLREAGATVTGGHIRAGQDTLYGLAVTGIVHPEKAWTNAGVRPGDVLILTKPLGAGVLLNAAKAGQTETAVTAPVLAKMAELDKIARDILAKYSVHGCAAVGREALLGCTLSMAKASGCDLHILPAAVPLYRESLALAEQCDLSADIPEGVLPGKTSPSMLALLAAPQISGGLLAAVAEEDAKACLAQLRKNLSQVSVIGYALPGAGTVHLK